MRLPFFFRRQPLLSPTDLLARAFVVSLAFGVVHLLGWREYTSFLSGTLASNSMPSFYALFMGLTYIVLFLAFTLLAPALFFAALLARGLNLLFSQSRKHKGGAS
ncbi:MAG TPA: hypothetical protein DCZ95_12870 [Verrucomicrobia bacterium]|nr:MAG: hypothetical protein A2X46_11790 [Lentisphaerae bacterium GWF2_57_35]HBA84980.1 hypothetical protein [Verrucomicrobiota bacterium]